MAEKFIQITIQTIKDKQVFKFNDNSHYKKDFYYCMRKGIFIEFSIRNKIYLINPANIIWIEISEEQGD
ncbi:hypothetical protein LCGC14_2341530 [marine sediment metagenome]|uniref:Uncharacterized protein n=1 Tax=marine sediment metagenome TaxID=412755 RepID=A0A0F9CCQ8_9ZZZZ